MRLKSLTLIAMWAFAQIGSANPLEEIVVTASRVDQAAGELASSVGVLRKDALDDVSHTHINEIMQRVSGAWISRGNGQEHLTAIRSPVLTGAGGCGAFLMAQDGVPLRAAGFCNVNELFESHSEMAEQIEVIKGPGSAFHGSNAMHGLINVITPRIRENPETNLRWESGPHEYNRLKLATARDNWRLDFSGTSDGGYKDASGYGQQKLTTKYQTRLGGFDTTTTVSASNLNQETSGFVQAPRAYKFNGLKRDNPNPEAYRDARSLRLQSRMTRDTTHGSLVLTPYARYADMDFLQHFLPGQAKEENGQRSVGLQLSFAPAMDWLAGFDGEVTRGFLKETQANPTTGSAFLVATIPAGAHYHYDVDAKTAAVFGQYQFGVGANAEVTLGARYEWLAYEYDNKLTDGRRKPDGSACGFGGCRFNRPADRDDTFTNFSPKLGLVYQFHPDHQLHIQVARGFRAPQATELYRLQANQSVSEIHSESLDSFELGFRGNLGGFDYALSGYYMRKENFIFRDTSRANIDNGETSHRGIEITAHTDLAKNLTANFFWSYARHEYDNNPRLSSAPLAGNDIDTAPRSMGSANLQWIVNSSVRTELEWVHLGEYYLDPENTRQYPGHDLINLRLNIDFASHWSVSARLTNLTNADYAERADLAFGNERYFIGEPRSLFLGIGVEF